MEENEILEPAPAPVTLIKVIKRRRELLPWWVKAFIWIFIVFAAMMPIAVVWAIVIGNFQLSLLGLSTNHPFSLTGLFLIALFLLKGVTAYALWDEKDWAITLAKTDAVISGVVCCLVMMWFIVDPQSHSFSLRLELVAIIPYYLAMGKIENDWKFLNNAPVTNVD